MDGSGPMTQDIPSHRIWSLVAERAGLASRGLRIQRTDSCPRLAYANRNLPDEPVT